MGEHDEDFAKTFMLVLGILVVFMIAVMIAANLISATTAPERPAWTDEQISKRIAPIGSAYTGDEKPPAAEAPAPAAAAPAAAAPAAAMSGDQVYQTACFVCHGTGAAGAPKIGDSAAWAPRIAQGMETLYQHATGGFKGMPAKGGRADLADDAIKAAIEYMVGQSK